MSLTIKDEGGEFIQPPTGTFGARCVRVIDLGTQEGSYEGKIIVKKQVLITWELPTELMTTGDHAGEPFTISKFYTASLNEKANLRKDLESWRGRAFTEQELDGFHLKNILGAPCMLSIIPNDKGRSKISAVASLIKGMEIAPAFNDPYFFDFDNWDEVRFQSFSDGIKKMIRNSEELKGKSVSSAGGACSPSEEVDAGDIPF